MNVELSDLNQRRLTDERENGRRLFYASRSCRNFEHRLKECERFARIIDRDFVIAKKIVPDDTVEFRSDGGT